MTSIVVIEIGDDGCVLRAAPQGTHPESRIEHDARRRIQHGLGFARMRRVAAEIVLVLRGKSCNIEADQRYPLGADDVIRGGRTLLGDACHVVAAREGKRARVLVGSHHYREARTSATSRRRLAIPARCGDGVLAEEEEGRCHAPRA
jgi:hypothetical protein